MKRLFPSLPEAPILGDVFQAFPAHIAPLMHYHDTLLRGPSDLSVGERELIAAYVSGLNACAFCTGAHTAISMAYGISQDTIKAMVTDLATSPVDEKLKPVLAYAGKLALTPARMVEADAEAVYKAGWSEAALFDAVQVCGLFNLMNRIVEGAGVSRYPVDPAEIDPERRERFKRKTCYVDYGRSLGIM